jgi:hypothetical protein
MTAGIGSFTFGATAFGAQSVTALEVIQDALELLGVYGPGDAISGADSARALSVMNDMLDVWSNEPLACFAHATQSFPLAVGQPQYTIGPGGDMNTVRPIRIIDAAGSAYLTDDEGNRYMMNVVDQLTWNNQTTSIVDADLPTTLFYDPQFPLGIINIWPTPDVAYTCSFMSYLPLAAISLLSGAFSLPPGYKRAITTNLAVCLKPYFTGSQLDPDVREEARETKGTIKRSNMRPVRSVYDPELVARGSSTYNIYSDGRGGR